MHSIIAQTLLTTPQHPAHGSQPSRKHQSHASQSRMAGPTRAPGTSLARSSLPGLHQVPSGRSGSAGSSRVAAEWPGGGSCTSAPLRVGSPGPETMGHGRAILQRQGVGVGLRQELEWVGPGGAAPVGTRRRLALGDARRLEWPAAHIGGDADIQAEVQVDASRPGWYEPPSLAKLADGADELAEPGAERLAGAGREHRRPAATAVADARRVLPDWRVGHAGAGRQIEPITGRERAGRTANRDPVALREGRGKHIGWPTCAIALC